MEKILTLLFLFWVFTELGASLYWKKHLRGKLFLIPALIALGTAAYGMYQSSQQKKKAQQLKPSNYSPPSLLAAKQNQERDAIASVTPGYNRALEKLQQSTASTISNAKRIGGTPGQIQQAAANADAREKEAIKDLEVNNDQFRQARRADLNRTLQIEGGYQKDAYDHYNAAKSALLGASQQNAYNAITGLAEGAANEYYDAQAKKDKLKLGDGTVPQAASASRPMNTDVRAGSAEDQIARMETRLGRPLSEMKRASINKKYFGINGFQTGY